jgi:hypothetical protein
MKNKRHQHIDFSEERPGVWKTATPEDGAKLDAAIDAALGSLGTSLAELKETQQEDETPTVCTDPACGRVQPRWTMEQVGGRWVCSPKYAMSCGRCCDPGVFLTHYKEDEHQPPCLACDSETHARCQHTLGRQLP